MLMYTSVPPKECMCNKSSTYAQWPQPMGIHVQSSSPLPISLTKCLYKVLHMQSSVYLVCAH